MILNCILYIYYLIYFWKCSNNIKALRDLSSEFNTRISAYTLKLNIQVKKTNVKAYKIDESSFQIFKIVIASF